MVDRPYRIGDRVLFDGHPAEILGAYVERDDDGRYRQGECWDHEPGRLWSLRMADGRLR